MSTGGARCWCAPTRRCHAGLTHHLAALGVECSVGVYLHHFDIHTVLEQLPEQAAHPAGEHGSVIEPRDAAAHPERRRTPRAHRTTPNSCTSTRPGPGLKDRLTGAMRIRGLTYI